MRKLQPEKKEAILVSAKKLFRHYGVQKTTMQEIATGAGMAVGTLYLYFKNKDDIVAECADEYADRHKKIIGKVLKSTAPAADRLRQYILHRYKENLETRKADSHAYEIARAVLRLRPNRIKEESGWMYETIRDLLIYGNKSGEFQVKNPESDSIVFLYSIAWFFPIAKPEFDEDPNEADLSKVMDWFIEKWQTK